MSDQKVPTQRTVLAATDVYGALRDAWATLVGTAPTRDQILCLQSQVWLETADGQRSNNFALAGIKYTHGCGRDYAAYFTHEILGGVDTTLEQDFRAYSTLTDAAYDYLRLLRGQFGFCWPAVETADIPAFGHCLHARGWYTANEQGYIAGMQSRRALLETQIPPDPPATVADIKPLFVPPDPTPGTDPPDDVA